MIRALFTAATGLQAQQTNIDVIANNLANVNTSGFKKSRADFQDLLYQVVQDPGAPTSQNTKNPTGIQVGLGVKTAAVQKVFAQGDLTSTGNQLDLAIEGEGFFQVQKPDGTNAYSRAGTFKLNETVQMVTSDGFTLASGVTIPANALSISIAQDGTVSARVPGSTTATAVGTISAVRFANPAGLRASGQNLYEETESSGTPTTGTFGQDGYGRVAQGFLESSNVSVVEEVVSMILAQRAYEANSKSIETADSTLSAAINLKR